MEEVIAIQETLTVEIELIEEMLGTMPGNPEIYEEYIQTRNPNGIAPDETAAHPNGGQDNDENNKDNDNEEDILEKKSTIFARREDQPIIWDYHVKGFLKATAEALRRVPGSPEKKLTAYRRRIDTLIFVQPRQIVLQCDPNLMGWCERPLRVVTAKGERIALARSETVPTGTKLQARFECLDQELMPFVRRWLNYGERSGLGQWRNSGKGRFIWRVI